MDLDAAIALAKQENKYVFVDTYASWCGPCKVMDRVFEESEVSNYFNANFINVKIDMEGPQGDKMLYDYEVVWLPTLLVIDGSGMVLSKIDQLISGSELVKQARSAIAGQTPIAAPSVLSSNPFNTGGGENDSELEDYDPIEKEEVIYVYDEKASSGRPHIMYHEAYLHLQLMDGQHQMVVKKYLSTQSDWNKEKNIKFIFDFLQNVRSPHFEYFVSHRPRFEEVIGKEKVALTLSILISERITKGFPRPTLEEAKTLYRHLDPALSDQRAYDYYLPRLYNEGKKSQYVIAASNYIKYVNPYDVTTICNLVNYRSAEGDLSHILANNELIERALTLDSQNPRVHFLAAKLHCAQKNKAQAFDHITKAMIMAQYEKMDIAEYVALQKQIESLL